MKALIFGAVAVAAAGPAAAFWGDDVWEAPDRPFLYYGEAQTPDSEKAPAEAPQVPLASLTTLEALRAERERRLSAAVMTPTAETIRDYLEVNAFVNDKAARFAAGWRDVLLSHPEFDWTALHPTVNAASTALARDDERRTLEVAAGLGRDWGLILFADASPLTRLMLPITERFAATLGLELVVARVGEGPALAKNDPLTVKPDAGLHRVAAGGLTVFPALVLVNRADPDLTKARLMATGVVDVAELTRRLVRLTGSDHPAVPRALPAVFEEKTGEQP